MIVQLDDGSQWYTNGGITEESLLRLICNVGMWYLIQIIGHVPITERRCSASYILDEFLLFNMAESRNNVCSAGLSKQSTVGLKTIWTKRTGSDRYSMLVLSFPPHAM
jgi:hypothetical protein